MGLGRRCAKRRGWCWTRWDSRRTTCPGTSGGSSGGGKATPFRRGRSSLLRRTDCAFFGAITSKPAAEAVRELAPELRDSGLTYRSPIVRMRQMLDLYICLRPCRAFPGNPLNYREKIDLVVFRENTEGHVHRGGVSQDTGSVPYGSGGGQTAAGRRDFDSKCYARGVAADCGGGVSVRRQERPAQGDGGTQSQRTARHLRSVSGGGAGGGGAVSAESSSIRPTWTPCACGCSRIR